MKKLFYIIVSLTIFSLPLFSALALNTDQYTPLEPSFFGKSGGTIEIADYFGVVYNVALGAAVVLAVLMIVIAGVQYTAAGVSQEARTSARGRIEHALIGLGIALLAVLLLNTINPDILKTGTGGSTLPPVSGGGGGTPGAGGGGGTPGAGSTPGSGGKYTYIVEKTPYWDISAKYDTLDKCNQARLADSKSKDTCTTNGYYNLEIVIRRRLAESPTVSVNNSPCLSPATGADTGQTVGCTNISRLPEIAITRVKELRGSSACNCSIMINGGTENGHATHGIGIAAIDIDYSVKLKDFLVSKLGREFKPCTKDSNNRLVRDYLQLSGPGAGKYYWEPAGCGRSSGDHWHVEY